MPFQRRFSEATDFQTNLLFGTLILTAFSTALFIAPTAFHRFTFRRQQKERLVRLGNKLAIAGVAALGLAMTGAVALITDFLYGSTATIITSSLILLMFISLWIVLPMHGRHEAEDEA